jgi:pimeloyl-ACP methyl ester carboxylesterase
MRNNTTFSDATTTVDGYSLFVRTNNKIDAKTIVLVHGIGVSEKYFRPLAAELSFDYNVISVNLPGWDKSQKPTHSLNIDELADILSTFISSQNLREPILIGQSMGCQIVARLIARTSTKFDKVILLGPTVNKYERNNFMQLWRLIQDGFREPFAMNLLLVTDYLKFGPLRYILTQHYMIKDKIEKSLAMYSMHVLLVRGSNDPIAPGKWIEYLSTITGKTTVKEIADGPHNVHFTHPKELALICKDFIG